MTYFARNKLTGSFVELEDHVPLPDGYAFVVFSLDGAMAGPGRTAMHDAASDLDPRVARCLELEAMRKAAVSASRRQLAADRLADAEAVLPASERENAARYAAIVQRDARPLIRDEGGDPDPGAMLRAEQAERYGRA